jgi:hypothetical protein
VTSLQADGTSNFLVTAASSATNLGEKSHETKDPKNAMLQLVVRSEKRICAGTSANWRLRSSCKKSDSLP